MTIGKIYRSLKSWLVPYKLNTTEGRKLFAKTYVHALWFVVYLFLVLQFSLLERYVVPKYWVSSVLDQFIPFIPAFVIPYVLWFPIVGVILIVLCFSDREDFTRTIWLLYLGMFTANMLYMFFPHGQPLRPIITETDFFSRAIRYDIYANDTNTNCFPSIHVLNQMAVHIGLCKSKLFKNRKGWKIASLIATILVCASTCFIKQHSILDVLAALALEWPLYLLAFVVDWTPVRVYFQKMRRRPLSESTN